MRADRLRNFLFYSLKPLIPRAVQIYLRRQLCQHKREKYAHIWPIDPNSAQPPQGWPGWPEGSQFGLVLSHDVDTAKGYHNVLKLADLEEEMGFRSQFNFVPERYAKVEIGMLEELKRRGFGIGVHGLTHDGKLFSTREIFKERSHCINSYLVNWGTKAFTTPSMIRNHEWMCELDVDYCISTFDTDPFEPQSDGAGTIFPYWVSGNSSNHGFLELPYTLVQDFTLFVLLGEKTIDIWKQKLDWIAANGGMALLNSHPDYMSFTTGPCGSEEYPATLYSGFLTYVKHRYHGQYWHVLPSEVWKFWATAMQSHLINIGASKRPWGNDAAGLSEAGQIDEAAIAIDPTGR